MVFKREATFIDDKTIRTKVTTAHLRLLDALVKHGMSDEDFQSRSHKDSPYAPWDWDFCPQVYAENPRPCEYDHCRRRDTPAASDRSHDSEEDKVGRIEELT